MGDGALFVIGLHGSGDTVALFLQDLGGGNGSLELRYSPGHAVPRIIRSLKETWLVWILNEPVG